MPSTEDTNLQIQKTSSGPGVPSTIKAHHIPTPPEKGPKRPRLFSCNRVEFQKKDVEYERLQAIRQIYSSRGILGGTQGEGVQFVTKVQIKKSKTPVPSDKRDENCESPENTDGTAKPEKHEEGGVLENETDIEKQTSDKSLAENKNVELLWSDSVTSTVDYTDVSKLVRTLSQQLKQNRLLLHRSRQNRPTASFAAPTKGEINLLLKSPEAKKAIEAKKCNGHQIILFNRGRALSLPVSNYFAVDKRPYRIPMGVVRPNTGGVQVQKKDISNGDRHLCSQCRGRASVE